MNRTTKLIRLVVLLLCIATVTTPAWPAFTANFVWEAKNVAGVSDANNSGVFDPGQTAGMLTDGAATLATSTAPVFTSASYNFVAGDVNAWVYIPAGTNWIGGWYKIVSVASNAATLDGTAGHGVLKTVFSPTTLTGCATTASPTGATWTIDYSQQASPKFTYTDLVSVGTGLTCSSAANPFGKQQVGNGIVITAGTNFNTGRYVIVSVATVTATVIASSGNLTTGAGISGVGSLGGALATQGQEAILATIAGMRLFNQFNATDYTLTSGSAGPAGPVALTAGVVIYGYDQVRGDNTGNRPTMNWGSVAAPGSPLYMIAQVSGACAVFNMRVDGNAVNNVCGISSAGAGNETNNCRAVRCNGTGGIGYLAATGGIVSNCMATTCSNSFSGTGGTFKYCTSVNSTGVGFQGTSNCTLSHDLAYGSGGDGGNFSSTGNMVEDSTFSGNAGDGLDFGANRGVIENTILSYNGGFGENSSSAVTIRQSRVADIGNTSGRNNSAALVDYLPITCTVDPFVSRTTFDFRPNYITGGGLLLIASGLGVSGQTDNQDTGAVQHSDPSVGSAY